MVGKVAEMQSFRVFEVVANIKQEIINSGQFEEQLIGSGNGNNLVGHWKLEGVAQH